MLVLLGGRAAEHLSFGHLSTGAADDLDKASEIARSMVTRYGMGGKLGPVSYGTEPGASWARSPARAAFTPRRPPARSTWPCASWWTPPSGAPGPFSR